MQGRESYQKSLPRKGTLAIALGARADERIESSVQGPIVTSQLSANSKSIRDSRVSYSMISMLHLRAPGLGI